MRLKAARQRWPDAPVWVAGCRWNRWPNTPECAKVSINDDIDAIALRYLGPNSIFKRAGIFSRIGIAVKYNKEGDEKERSLNINISGSKSCNLQSNKDPDERSLGFALLSEWGILNTFRQIENGMRPV